MSCELVSPQSLSQSVRRAVARVRLTRCPHVEEDLCQSVAVSLLGRARVDDGIPGAYVQVAARNAVIDHLRRQVRRPHDLGAAPAGQPRPWGPDPAVRLIDTRVRGEIVRQLRALPDARRRAVTAYLHGETVPAIAQTMGCNQKRADNLVYRGLAALRRGLEDAGVTPACYS